MPEEDENADDEYDDFEEENGMNDEVMEEAGGNAPLSDSPSEKQQPVEDIKFGSFKAEKVRDSEIKSKSGSERDVMNENIDSEEDMKEEVIEVEDERGQQSGVSPMRVTNKSNMGNV